MKEQPLKKTVSSQKSTSGAGNDSANSSVSGAFSNQATLKRPSTSTRNTAKKAKRVENATDYSAEQADERAFDYMLTPAEMLMSRGGYSRTLASGARLYDSSMRNDVEFIMNDVNFYKELHDQLDSLGEGDFVWAGMFRSAMSLQLNPNPDDPDSGETALKNMLIKAIDRGADLRLMVCTNITMSTEQLLNDLKDINAAAKSKAVERGEITEDEDYAVFIPDNRHLSIMGNLHQKAWVFGKKTSNNVEGASSSKSAYDLTAYVGGADPGNSRFDDIRHNQVLRYNSKGEAVRMRTHQPFDPIPVAGTETDNFQGGWTESMLKIKGSAAQDVAHLLHAQITDSIPALSRRNIGENYARRISNFFPPAGKLSKLSKLPQYIADNMAVGGIAGGNRSTAEMANWQPGAQKVAGFPNTPLPKFVNNVKGETLMQLIATIGQRGAQSGLYQSYAPQGDVSYLAAVLKAIRQARKYIMVVDQFLYYKPIMDQIAARMQQVPKLQVIAFSNPPATMQQPGHSSEMVQVAGWYARSVVQEHGWQEITKFKSASFDPDEKGFFSFSSWNQDAAAMTNDGQKPLGPEYTTSIYNHQKVLMIDDEYVIHGSMSQEPTGLTTDQDIGFGMYNPDKVQQMRKELFAEFLGLEVDDEALSTWQSSFNAAVNQANNGNGRLRWEYPDSNKELNTLSPYQHNKDSYAHVGMRAANRAIGATAAVSLAVFEPEGVSNPSSSLFGVPFPKELEFLLLPGAKPKYDLMNFWQGVSYSTLRNFGKLYD